MKLRYFILSAIMLPLLGACSDDDVVGTPLSSPTVHDDGVTPTSLRFSWDAVPGAVQYAYELRQAAGEALQGGTTTSRTATFTGLTPSTDYELYVWALADVADQSKSQSPAFILKGRTADQTALPLSGVSAQVSGSNATITWTGSEDAAYYTYSCTGETLAEPITGSTYDTYVELKGLDQGSYTVTVQAISENEWFVNSEPQVATFDITKCEIARYTGTFVMDNYPNSPWNADIAYYDDGSYSIKSWYTQEGYNIDFSVDENGNVEFLNVPYDGSYYYIDFGPNNPGYFTGGTARISKSGGQVYITEYYSGGFNFTWQTGLEDVVKNWESTGLLSVYNFDGSQNTSYTPWNVTLESYSDGTYVLRSWFGYSGYDLTFTVNDDPDHTIHFLGGTDEQTTDSGTTVNLEYCDGYVGSFYQDDYSSFFGDETGGDMVFTDLWYQYNVGWGYDTNLMVKKLRVTRHPRYALVAPKAPKQRR